MVILKKKNGNKYLVFDSLNNELSRKYPKLWKGLKKQINSKSSYKKDSTKIMFNSDDNLPLKKPPKFYVMTIVVRYVIE